MAKRIGARFSSKQRAAMRAKAIELGWKVPRQELLNVTRWCEAQDILLRQFKTWMNNNKKKEAGQVGDGGVVPDLLGTSRLLRSCRRPRHTRSQHGDSTFEFFKVMVPTFYEERLVRVHPFGYLWRVFLSVFFLVLGLARLLSSEGFLGRLLCVLQF